MTEKEKEWYMNILFYFVYHFEILKSNGFDYQFMESQIIIKHKIFLYPGRKLVWIYSWDK